MARARASAASSLCREFSAESATHRSLRAAMSVEEAKAYVVNMKLAERLTEAVNAAIKEMPAKPYAFLVRCRRIAILAPPP
jgi:hypothetical protein